MSFNSDVKREIILSPNTDNICLLSGLAHSAGNLVLERDGHGLDIVTDIYEVAQYAVELLNEIKIDSQVTMEEPYGIVKKNTYTISVRGNHARILLDLCGLAIYHSGNLESVVRGVDRDLLPDERSKISYLKGVFLGKGAVYVPSGELGDDKKMGYHLELALSSEEFAHDLMQIIQELGVNVKSSVRRDTSILYLKDGDGISDMLALMGAMQSVLKIQDVMVVRSVRNNANRQTNCNIANITKSVLASSDQIEAIEYIKDKVGLDYLTDDLRKTADCRVSNPDATLDELAEILGISKSGVNHRLRKIKDIYRQLQKRLK